MDVSYSQPCGSGTTSDGIGRSSQMKLEDKVTVGCVQVALFSCRRTGSYMSWLIGMLRSLGALNNKIGRPMRLGPWPQLFPNAATTHLPRCVSIGMLPESVAEQHTSRCSFRYTQSCIDDTSGLLERVRRSYILCPPVVRRPRGRIRKRNSGSSICRRWPIDSGTMMPQAWIQSVPYRPGQVPCA